MSSEIDLPHLTVLAPRVATLLKARGQTVAVVESSAGGLASAALLAVSGASAFFVGAAVIYTKTARRSLLGVTDEEMINIQAETEPYAALLANRIRSNVQADWGLAESGASGPKPSPYGDPAGHLCGAIAGATDTTSFTTNTGLDLRQVNMDLFARRLLYEFEKKLQAR